MDGRHDSARLGGVLAPDERARAARFRQVRDRERYIVRHAWLRAVLGSWLGREPGTLQFTANSYGKPALAGGPAFSLSHSHDCALLAVCEDLEVGCDIERHDSGTARAGLAERVFAPAEAAALAAVAAGEEVAAFFACWTCKEAYVKALGLGLHMPLDRFEVELPPGAAPRLGAGCGSWSLRSFEPTPGYSAAVVASGRDWRLRQAEPFPFI